MGKNKIKTNKETKINEVKSQIHLTKQQKVQNLVSKINDLMYESLESGNIKINSSQKTAKNLIRKSNKFLSSQILNGEIQINENKTHLTKRKSKSLAIDEEDIYLNEQNITTNNILHKNNTNKNLRQIYENLQREKQLQRNHQKQLEEKAKLFIVKMQKQKQKFEENLKSKKSSSRLNTKVYSEDTIRVMKERLQEKVRQKRRQLTDKIQNIEKRKTQRIQNQVNNQISYWEKVRKYESLKHLSVFNHQQILFFPQLNFPKSVPQRSTSQPKILHRYSKNKAIYPQLQPKALDKKFNNIENYVLKAKLKLQNFQKKIKVHSIDSKKKQIIESQLFHHLYISNKKQINPENHSFKFDLIKNTKPIIQLQHKTTVSGKDPKQLQKIRRLKSLTKQVHINEQNLTSVDYESLKVNANIIKPSKNFAQSSLEISWNQTLNKIKYHEIDKIKGLNHLASIQKRLDKIDQQGIINRLKLKAYTIYQMENNQKKIENQESVKNQQIKNKIETQNNEQNQQTDTIKMQIQESNDSVSSAQSKNEFITNQQFIPA